MSKVSNISLADTAPKSLLVSADPNRIEYAKDSNGRQIGARTLHALDMFELTLLLGEHSGNQAALNQALMAASVVEIDGRQVTRPLTLLELKARIKELDFAGYVAASEAVARFAVETTEVNKNALKN
jgi:hypothetical protein